MNLKLEKCRMKMTLTPYGLGTAMAVALASRVIVVIASIAAVSIVGVRSVAGWRIEVPLAGMFARWDSAYYLTIAECGYVQENLYPFRPLYPLLLRSIATLVGKVDWQTMAVIGFAASNLFFVVSVFFLYKLTEQVYSRKEAYRTVALFSLSPGTVYLSAVYPEALYLTLLFATLYLLSKSKVFSAAFLSLLATLARPEGVLVALLFLAAALKYADLGIWRLHVRRNFLYYMLAATFPIVGTIFFGLYVGDMMQPFLSELMWSKWTLAKFIGLWWLTEPDGPAAILSFTVLLLLFGTFSTGSRRMLEDEGLRGYLIWSLALLILFLTSADFRSLPRLSLQIAPVYWILSSSSHWQAFLALLASLAVYGAILYASWYPLL